MSDPKESPTAKALGLGCASALRAPVEDVGQPACACDLDGDWWACCDGRVYGPCEDERCGGVCELKYDCGHACHRQPLLLADHPHADPGDGRKECDRCGKWVFEAIHSCKGVPVTQAAVGRYAARLDAAKRPGEAGSKTASKEDGIDV